MSRYHESLPRLLAALVLCAAATTTSSAAADPTTASREHCVVAAREGQRAQKGDRLVEAATRFAECSSADCPNVIQTDCARWSAEVEQSIPTFVFAVVNTRGADLVEVRLEVDGKLVLSRIDGSLRPLDPGSHALVFTTNEGARTEIEIVARAGEKRRMVRVTVPDAPPKEAPVLTPTLGTSVDVRPTRSRLAPLVLGGVAVTALGVATYLQFAGAADVAEVRERCGLGCPRAEVEELTDRASRYEWGARAALGTGILALVVAAYLYVR